MAVTYKASRRGPAPRPLTSPSEGGAASRFTPPAARSIRRLLIPLREEVGEQQRVGVVDERLARAPDRALPDEGGVLVPPRLRLERELGDTTG